MLKWLVAGVMTIKKIIMKECNEKVMIIYIFLKRINLEFIFLGFIVLIFLLEFKLSIDRSNVICT